MRRSIAWLLSIILAATTGAVLSGTVAVLTAPMPDPHGSQTNAAVVWAFYDTVNAILATGDTTSLDALIAEEMVEHTPVPGLPPTRSGFTRYLLSLHATVPEMRLVPEDVHASGDHVTARVRITGVASGASFGSRLDGDAAVWGALDQFRVVNRRIVEHWGSAHVQALLEPLHQLSVGMWDPTHQIVGLERLSYLPGSELDALAIDESRLLYLESGELTVAIDAESPTNALLAVASNSGTGGQHRVIAPGANLTLLPGDLLAMPALGRYAIRNDGSVAAEAIVVTAFAPRSGPRLDDVSSHLPGDEGISVRVTPLAGFIGTNLPHEPAMVGFGRATLAPGRLMTLPEASGPLLLTVEAGSVGVDSGDGTAWVRRGADGRASLVSDGLLATGDGLLVKPGGGTEIHNLGDTAAVILVATILPDDTER